MTHRYELTTRVGHSHPDLLAVYDERSGAWLGRADRVGCVWHAYARGAEGGTVPVGRVALDGGRDAKALVAELIARMTGARRPLGEDGHPASNWVRCETCGACWDDAVISAVTPAPAGRCPVEYAHPAPSERRPIGHPRDFRGWVVYRERGWWHAWRSGELRLRADTLEGVKALVRHSEAL